MGHRLERWRALDWRQRRRLLGCSLGLAVIHTSLAVAGYARTRAAIWASKELPLSEALEDGWRHILAQNNHPDIAEGVAAFLEKRAPRWRDRDPGDVA